ncbi:MAG: hypothetical protein ACTSUV_05045 [Candidatus Ranarchaeia archaeon]
MAIIETRQIQSQMLKQPVKRRKRSKIPSKKNRMSLIYDYLDGEKRWVSTKEIHNEFPYVKRTLRATLSTMVDSNLVQRVLSLKDTRVKLYRIKQ